ncbi:DUF6603 domain-containing protein [Pseudonocardia sp.]|uniref:DUF6603 domain-containing protein n=1 Tax=Pseudonocardia sp. TaxID=60912 RepID=UPI00261EDB6F|nr:DUF6603 domain-containing protein [Pseudonocardia sp.]
MSEPTWLAAGRTLRVDDPALAPLGRLFAVVAPDAETVAVVVERVTGAAGSPRTWEGTAPLWGSDRARFGIAADATGAPTSAWVARPVTLAAGIDIPGLSTDVFWMILSAQVAEQPWVLDPAEPPMLAMVRHLVGPVRVGDRPVLVRLDLLGETMTASVDLDGTLTDVERAVLGPDPGGPGVTGLGFADLAALLGTAHDPHADLAWLPEPLRTPETFTLDEVHLRLDASDDRVLIGVGAAVRVGRDRRWPLVPGFDVLTVGGIVVRFDVDHPLDPLARFPRVSVAGDIGLGAATVRVGARWPDLAVQGHLVDGGAHPVVLDDLLAALHLPVLGGSGPAITELGFTARPGTAPRTFTLHARAADLLTVPVGGAELRVRDLELDLALDRAAGPGEQRALRAGLRGELALGERSLSLRAVSDHGGHGWTLRALLTGEPLELGELAAWIAERFGDHPLPQGLMSAAPRVERLELAFHTGSGDASFEIVTGAQLGAVSGELRLDLALAHHGADAYRRTVSGRLRVGDHTFDLLLARDAGDPAAAGGPVPPAGSEVLVAAYRRAGTATVGDLLAAVGIDLPIPVALSDALLARTGGATLALVDMGAGFDLSRLPLVGKMFAGTDVALDLRLVVASGDWDAAAVRAVNAALPAGYGPLDEPATALPPVGLVVALTLGTETVHLDLGVELDHTALPTPAGPAPAGPAPAATRGAPPVTHAGSGGEVSWYPVQRAFGPVHLRRVGARFDPGTRSIELLLDADLGLAGLTLSLDGLSVATPLTSFEPTFGLRGLGLDVRTGAFELGGTFLRLGAEEFAGAALLRTETLSLSAIGAYGVVDGHPSLFVYAVLDYPLGGPSFFFVTGLAAGLGYHRRLVLPTVDRIAEFPLVAQAGAGAGAALPEASELMATLESFEEFLPPAVGEMFAAAGIRFTSFSLIDSFALLTVSLGERLRIDLLGTSTLVAPTPVPGSPVDPVAEIHLGYHARFLPDEGFLGVDARLTSASYVLSRSCHLTGGAAFHSWFAGPHAGDFVVTLGGYHPAFRVPAHYPRVPRPTLSWQVSDEIAIKGDLYYALTGHAIMAGGHFDASYTSGAVEAWFRMGADFLASWQPFAYDARAYVDVGARWHAIEVEVGVDVHVWGPEFAGVAEVDLTLTSFTVHFGDTRPPATAPVSWDGFRAAALPASTAIVGVSCGSGLVRPTGPGTGFDAEWVVSAHDLVMVVATQVPATGYRFNGSAATTVPGATHAIGIAPMGVAVGGLDAPLTVTVQRTADGTAQDMVLTPVRKAVPAALWGEPSGARPAVNGSAHVPDTLAGFELRPPRRAAPGSSTPVRRDAMAYDDIPARVAGPGWTPEPVPVGEEVAAVPPAEVARARAALLRGLGVDPGLVRPGPDLDEMFLARPVAVELTVPPESS